MPVAATSQAPPSALAATGDADAHSSLRSLAIDTLCDLMRRGQAHDGRRQAATVALRYLSQLDRLASMTAIAAARTAASADKQQSPEAPASAPPAPDPAPQLPPPAAPHSVAAAPLPAALAPDPKPLSRPSAAELRTLMDAVRDAALAPADPPDPIVILAPRANQLPALSCDSAFLNRHPRLDTAAPLGPRQCAPVDAGSPRRPGPLNPTAILAAAGEAGPAP